MISERVKTAEDAQSSNRLKNALRKLEYVAMAVPPVHNVAELTYTWKQDYSLRKKLFLTFENVGLYSAIGVGLALAGFSSVGVVGIVGVAYEVGVPIEWGVIKHRKHKTELVRKEGQDGKESILNWDVGNLNLRKYLVNQYQVFGYTALAFEAVKALLH